ncbi:hypothetical protein KCU93_g402, partial [Aureobasidium melanogenum]
MNSTRHRLRDISTLCDTVHIHLSQHFVDSLDNISLLQYFMHNLSFLSPILADFGSESSFPHNDVSHCTQRSELCERLLEKSGLRFNDESWGRWKHESAVGSGGPDQKANRGVSVLQRAVAVPPTRVEVARPRKSRWIKCVFSSEGRAQIRLGATRRLEECVQRVPISPFEKPSYRLRCHLSTELSPQTSTSLTLTLTLTSLTTFKPAHFLRLTSAPESVLCTLF